MTDDSLRSMKDWQLQAARDTNVRALAGLDDQLGLSDSKRDMMSASLGAEIRKLNREIARRQAVAAMKVVGVIIVALMWIGGSIAIGVFIDDAAGAIVFWIGLAIAAIAALVMWIGTLFKPRRHY